MASEFDLYGTATSTATSRVRLLLAEAGFSQFNFVALDFRQKQHKVRLFYTTSDVIAHTSQDQEHLLRHPWGKVPVLVARDGFTLFESRAICKFLATKYEWSFLPSDVQQRALFDQAESIEASYFAEEVRIISRERFVKPLLLQNGNLGQERTARCRNQSLDVLRHYREQRFVEL